MKRNISRTLSLILIFWGSLNLCADSSGELAYSLMSPLFLGGGSSVTKMNTPQGISLNPASAGNFQRIILDLNYSNLLSLDDSSMGHAANAALSYPTKYGVISGAGRLLTTDGLNAESLDFGTFGSLNFAFSKELYKNLYAGFGVNGSYGSGSDWGASINAGFIHRTGNWSGMENFRWGVSLNQIGKSYGSGISGSYFDAVPNNLTLQLGAGFDLISTDDMTWSITGDIGFPAMSDLKMEIGQEVLINDKLRIATSSSMILTDSLNGDFQTLIPSLGVFYKHSFSPKNGEKTALQTSELDFQAAVAPLYNEVLALSAGATIPFGVRDKDAPVLTHNYEDTIFISPDLNGTQDELDFPFSVEDERYIMGYTFSVYDEDGDLVKEFRNKDERPENESFKNIFDRMFSPKTGTALPDTFRWDGVADSGDIAPDGSYSYTMEFWDDNDNRTVSESMALVLDTVPPSISIEKPDGIDLIFSPDGDGNKETLAIKQSSSVENGWNAQVLNQQGETVKTFSWQNEEVEPFEWDGTDDAGIIVPDGVYSYFIESTDPSGNYGSESIDNILINTEQPPINLSIDNAWLSPGNGEGVDRIIFRPDIPVTSGILEWELQVQDLNGRSYWDYNSRREGVLEIPKAMSYAGDAGANGTLAEGKYRAYLTISYQNGYNPECYSPAFTVDVTAPVGTAGGDTILSPDGDGFKDILILNLDTSDEVYWEGFIRDGENKTVKSFFWRGKADPRIQWDGRDQDGKPVPDGRYTFHLEAFDKAGNRGISRPHAFTLDTRAMSVQTTVSEDAFSPDGNGRKDSVTFYSVVDNPENVESWTLEILNGTGDQVVKTLSGSAPVPAELVWKGDNDAAGQAPDGSYTARLSLIYEKGDRPSSRTTQFVKDTQPPVLKVSSPKTLFSPDGDGSGDSITILQESSAENELISEIIDSEGMVRRTWYWKDAVEDLEWDGTDENGNPLPDGLYSYRLRAEDLAGNDSNVEMAGIEIDTAATPVYLTAEHALLSPLSEQYPAQLFKVHAGNERGIEQWSLQVKRENGEVVKTISGLSSLPQEINWDGRADDGSLVEGVFTGEIALRYSKGNRPVAASRDFTVDNSAPLLGVLLSPQPFSPDDDNVDDELKIALNVRDLSPVRDWEMIIRDPKGQEFISFSGRGRPSERIIWDGRSRQGELVQSALDYPYEIRVTDLLGHSTVERGEIPVDILVIREGNRLKVRISNITFQPYKAALVDTGEQGEKNREVLARLSQVLKKYGSYRIQIEGHAVSEYYDNPARAAKEEKEELQPLSLARAGAVKEELNSLGIQESRMDILGKGGTEPVVPHSDLDNRWKNRRVEFILIK